MFLVRCYQNWETYRQASRRRIPFNTERTPENGSAILVGIRRDISRIFFFSYLSKLPLHFYLAKTTPFLTFLFLHEYVIIFSIFYYLLERGDNYLANEHFPYIILDIFTCVARCFPRYFYFFTAFTSTRNRTTGYYFAMMSFLWTDSSWRNNRENECFAIITHST